MRKLAVIITAIAIGLSLAVVPRAEASPSNYGVSLPYIDDVNDWGPGKVICTVVCCGDASAKLKVVDCKTHKRVKVHKEHKRVWTVVLKRNREYKLSVRAKGYEWKSIGYRVY